MAFTTWTDLKAAVADWIARGDLTSVIPDFIVLAEEQMTRDLADSPALWAVNSSITLASHAGTFSLPIGALGLITARLISPVWAPLRTVPLEQLLPTQGDTTAYAQPTVCAMGESTDAGLLTVRVWPYADQAYTVEALYPKAVPALGAGLAANFLLLRFPSLYLFGSLVQAIPYLGAERRGPIWEARYREAVAKVLDQRWSGEMTLGTDIPARGGLSILTG